MPQGQPASDARAPRAAGLILAGGRSRRFGADKATATLEGRPLLAWAAARLQSLCRDIAVSARAGSPAEALADHLGFPVLHDALGDAEGPLAGIRAGLAWAAARGVQALAVSPCDAPLLPADLFTRLARAGKGGWPAIAQTSEGLQPLCSFWPIGTEPAVTTALAWGAHPPIHALLQALGARSVWFDAPEAFSNINRPDDLMAVQARLG